MPSPASIRYQNDEIRLYVRRLRLSEGDLLRLAREVADDDTLASADLLGAFERSFLLVLLKWLAQPNDVHAFAA